MVHYIKCSDTSDFDKKYKDLKDELESKNIKHVDIDMSSLLSEFNYLADNSDTAIILTETNKMNKLLQDMIARIFIKAAKLKEIYIVAFESEFTDDSSKLFNIE
jgi:ABC-type phosphate transport system auxiliary subunit